MTGLAEPPLTLGPQDDLELPPALAITPKRLVGDRASLILCPLVYALLAWVLFAHLSLFDSRRIPGCACQDPANEIWFLGFERASLSSAHVSFWTDLIGYPAGVNIASSASFPLLGALASPFTAVFGPLATYNFLLRLGLFVSAMSGWLVLRGLLRSSIAAGAGGLVYGFSPYTIHAAQLHVFLAWVPLPPLILGALFRQFQGTSGRPWRTGMTVGALLAAQYLVNAEITASLVLVTLTTGLVVLLTRLIRAWGVALVRNVWIGIRSPLRDLAKVGVTTAVVAGCLLAVPLWQFLYGRQHVTAGFSTSDSGIPAITSVLAPSGVTPGIENLAGSWGLWSTHYSGSFGGTGYLGPLLIVAIGWIAYRNRGQPLVRLASLLLVVSWVLALGPYLVTASHVTHVALPFHLISRLPAFRDLIAGRMTLYLWLSVAILVAVSIDRCAAEISRSGTRYRGRRISRATLASVVLATAGLVLAGPSGRIKTSAAGTVTPFLSHRIQAEIPSGGVVLTYPFPAFPEDQAMVWQASDDMRFKLIGGYAKFPGAQTANLIPPLLTPRLVECFLEQAQFPDDLPGIPLGGCPTTEIKLSSRELKDFVDRNQVASIVVDREGGDPGRVIRLVTRTYGAPVRDGSFSAWRT